MEGLNTLKDTMYTLAAIHPDHFAQLGTKDIQANFLLPTLFDPGQINWTYTHYDRMMIGGLALGVGESRALETHAILRADYFLERRELVCFCIAGAGTVEADGVKYPLAKYDAIYIGKGTRNVSFAADDSATSFYLLSSPAHRACPTAVKSQADAEPTVLGSQERANLRTIYKYVHLAGLESCQLVAGMTMLSPGNVWNTMPTHVHDRRMEVYFYFDLPADSAVIHLLGSPDETRHIVVRNNQAVLSPPWSIHSGSGLTNYTFIWAMAGENLVYSDMDPVAIDNLA